MGLWNFTGCKASFDEYSCFFIFERIKLAVFRVWNKRLTADQAQKMYEQAVKLEQEFGEYFTGTVANYNKYLFTGNVAELHRVPKKLSRFVFVRTSSNFH